MDPCVEWCACWSSYSLVADTQLYKRLCPLVHPSVVEHKSKSMKLSVLDAFCVCVCRTYIVGGAWGMEGGWLPLPTHPHQYCDPASLVLDAIMNCEGCIHFLSSYFYVLVIVLSEHFRIKRKKVTRPDTRPIPVADG